jgi:hypothetical protein
MCKAFQVLYSIISFESINFKLIGCLVVFFFLAALKLTGGGGRSVANPVPRRNIQYRTLPPIIAGAGGGQKNILPSRASNLKSQEHLSFSNSQERIFSQQTDQPTNNHQPTAPKCCTISTLLVRLIIFSHSNLTSPNRLLIAFKLFLKEEYSSSSHGKIRTPLAIRPRLRRRNRKLTLHCPLQRSP